MTTAAEDVAGQAPKSAPAPKSGPAPTAEAIVRAICHPLVVLDQHDRIVEANDAAENFFRIGHAALKRLRITDLVPFGSPLLTLVEQVRERGAPVNEYGVDIGTPHNQGMKPVDLQVAPMGETAGAVLVMVFERAMANKIDRQLSHRGAARSVIGLAGMLGHEIKNPLSGIRGAAQLLGAGAEPGDKPLTQLICDETDRICRLIDRMEVFADDRPLDGVPVNVHAVLDRVWRIAGNGFASDIRFVTEFDPSLPPVNGDEDQLIQAFLNLVKNAAEAIHAARIESGAIHLRSAFRPGMRLSVPGSPDKVNLPLEFVVADNGPGVSPELMPHLFEPFVTSRANGSGLGLSLVAKIIGDHGGVIECESSDRGSVFRVLLPMGEAQDQRARRTS